MGDHTSRVKPVATTPTAAVIRGTVAGALRSTETTPILEAESPSMSPSARAEAPEDAGIAASVPCLPDLTRPVWCAVCWAEGCGWELRARTETAAQDFRAVHRREHADHHVTVVRF